LAYRCGTALAFFPFQLVVALFNLGSFWHF
jgi:hypothetical protein